MAADDEDVSKGLAQAAEAWGQRLKALDDALGARLRDPRPASTDDLRSSADVAGEMVKQMTTMVTAERGWALSSQANRIAKYVLILTWILAIAAILQTSAGIVQAIYAYKQFKKPDPPAPVVNVPPAAVSCPTPKVECQSVVAMPSDGK
jgi:hypothetical protein